MSFCWQAINNSLFSQLHPVLFLNRLDLTRNLLMLTDIQHAVINKSVVPLMLDSLYLLAPVTLLVTCIRNSKWQYPIAWINIIVNFVYAMMVTSMSTLSIEGFIGFIMVPLVFGFRSDVSFSFGLQLMRYFFLLIFVSAGLWKIRAGGLFNTEQMSAILLKQHAAYIYSSPENWYSRLILYFVRHSSLSWSIYLTATLTELAFITGFFTKKFDKLLIGLFIMFLLLNYFVMGINYISWTIFIFCMWYAKYPFSDKENEIQQVHSHSKMQSQ